MMENSNLGDFACTPILNKKVGRLYEIFRRNNALVNYVKSIGSVTCGNWFRRYPIAPSPRVCEVIPARGIWIWLIIEAGRLFDYRNLFLGCSHVGVGFARVEIRNGKTRCMNSVDLKIKADGAKRWKMTEVINLNFQVLSTRFFRVNDRSFPR